MINVSFEINDEVINVSYTYDEFKERVNNPQISKYLTLDGFRIVGFIKGGER